MNADRHPEFDVYLKQKQRVEVARRAVEAWITSDEPLLSSGTFSGRVRDAQALLRDIQALFAGYNRVLWQVFPYCHACGGGCCVPGASHVTMADAVAMTLLQLPFPERQPQIAASARECIYLEERACSWPRKWRPLKCWSFYCLGSGAAQLDASDERYGEITEALQALLDKSLPEALCTHAAVTSGELRAALADPIAFAEMLAGMLEDLLVRPLMERYPYLYEVTAPHDPEPGDDPNPLEATLAFIAEAGEALWKMEDEEVAPGLTGEQLLADLEQLEWIVTAQPVNAVLLLGQIVRRYTLPVEEEQGAKCTLASQLREQALVLMEDGGLVRTPSSDV